MFVTAAQDRDSDHRGEAEERRGEEHQRLLTP